MAREVISRSPQMRTRCSRAAVGYGEIKRMAPSPNGIVHQTQARASREKQRTKSQGR